MEKLRVLCELNGVSGREDSVREYIIDAIKDKAEITVDPMGNIIAFVKGKKRAVKKIMADAHMDEVGLIITSITDGGMLKFVTVGGIDVSVLLARRVRFNGNVLGVISMKPIHQLRGDEKDKMPSCDSLYIDIGANSKEEAEKLVGVGDCAAFDEKFEALGDMIVSKAIDDRAGCWCLIDIINSGAEYDFYATFTVQEEVGLRGAKTAAYSVDPDFAIAVESTTAADIAGVADSKKVCYVGSGAVLSFMDSTTLYDKALFDKALELGKEKGIACQVKSAVTGGNNAGAIHISRKGVRTLAVSVPCRYIHSPSCVANFCDIIAVRNLTKALIEKAALGEI